MSLLVVGLNYHTAPVQVRERLAFSREGVATALVLIRKQFPGAGAAILSTCNRVELLVNSDDDSVTADRVIAFLAQSRDVPEPEFRPHVYSFAGSDAARHIFRVISGLDSMVVGEYQIVNQLKLAYELATAQNTADPVLHRLFHHAFGVSKRVRTETAVADGKTSIASVAVESIRKAYPRFDGRRVLLVGAGEMARLTAEYLHADDADVVITTRTFSNAKGLAEVCGGRAVPFAELDDQLAQADVVITATSSPLAFLTRRRLAAARPADARKLLLVDLSVPRNIEPDVRDLPGVELLDVDALGRVVAETHRHRLGQIDAADTIISEEVEAFERWVAQGKVRPLIEQMFEDVRALASIEVRGFLRKNRDLTPQQQEAVTQLADRLVAKLMHPCVRTVREQTRLDSTALALVEAFHGARQSFDPAPAQAAVCPA